MACSTQACLSSSIISGVSNFRARKKQKNEKMFDPVLMSRTGIHMCWYARRSMSGDREWKPCRKLATCSSKFQCSATLTQTGIKKAASSLHLSRKSLICLDQKGTTSPLIQFLCLLWWYLDAWLPATILWTRPMAGIHIDFGYIVCVCNVCVCSPHVVESLLFKSCFRSTAWRSRKMSSSSQLLVLTGWISVRQSESEWIDGWMWRENPNQG